MTTYHTLAYTQLHYHLQIMTTTPPTKPIAINPETRRGRSASESSTDGSVPGLSPNTSSLPVSALYRFRLLVLSLNVVTRRCAAHSLDPQQAIDALIPDPLLLFWSQRVSDETTRASTRIDQGCS